MKSLHFYMYSGEINVFLGTDIRVHILVPQIVKLFYESDITGNTGKYAGIMEKLPVEFLLISCFKDYKNFFLFSIDLWKRT